MTGRAEIGRFGIWRSASLVTPEIAVGIERLGFGVLWLGSSPDGDLVQAEALLDATTTLTLATSIVNMWKDQAGLVARSYARVQQRHPGFRQLESQSRRRVPPQGRYGIQQTHFNFQAGHARPLQILVYAHK